MLRIAGKAALSIRQFINRTENHNWPRCYM